MTPRVCVGELDDVPVDVSPFGDFGGVGVRWNVSLSRRGLQPAGPRGYVVRKGQASGSSATRDATSS